eukprot:8357956-Alexandrium_andersonii.AAC.1
MALLVSWFAALPEPLSASRKAGASVERAGEQQSVSLQGRPMVAMWSLRGQIVCPVQSCAPAGGTRVHATRAVSYTHLRAHETSAHL